jgi:hypothetical protein
MSRKIIRNPIKAFAMRGVTAIISGLQEVKDVWKGKLTALRAAITPWQLLAGLDLVAEACEERLQDQATLILSRGSRLRREQQPFMESSIACDPKLPFQPTVAV